VRDAERRDHVADQRDAQRGPAVDDQHRSVAGGRQHPAHQRVVFEGADGTNRARKRSPAPELTELHLAAAHAIRIRVDEVSGEE